MKVLFLNPQGNFDKHDSHLTEHPDFGGQLVYVKEVSRELAKMNVSVDIVTRQIIDDTWPEFGSIVDYFDDTKNPRIIRIPFGGEKFLNKELLWPFLNEYVDNMITFYNGENIDFVTTHYADGGYSGVLLKSKINIDFSFTGHSLGAQKMDKIGVTFDNFEKFDTEYNFSKRIMAERLAMRYAYKIIVSTNMERFEQYSHPLYIDVSDVNNDNKFKVVPPGVNTQIFNDNFKEIDENTIKKITEKTKGIFKPFIILSSRLDEKKNHIGVVKAYASSKRLQEIANLGIFLRGISNPFEDINHLSKKEKGILKPILQEIKETKIEDKVYFFDFRSQKALASAYKYFAQLKSIFAITAFYEPFGLAPIEAGACGLAVVATKNGGPSEIFSDGSGVLVDPFDIKDIERGLVEALQNFELYSKKVKNRVLQKYTWKKTAEGYLEVIKEGIKNKTPKINLSNFELNAKELILRYLKDRE